VSGRKSLSQISYLQHQIISKMIICGPVEGVQHFRYNYLYIILSSHFKEQVQSLLLKSLIFAFETLHYRQLIFIKQFAATAVEHTQSLNPQILHVVCASTLQQFGKDRG
jgi:hypothetical protein